MKQLIIAFLAVFILPAIALSQTPSGYFFVRYFFDTNLTVHTQKQELKWMTGTNLTLDYGPYTTWKIHTGPFIEVTLISSGLSNKNNGHFTGSSGDFGGGVYAGFLDHWRITLKMSSIHNFDSDLLRGYIRGPYNFVELRYTF